MNVWLLTLNLVDIIIILCILGQFSVFFQYLSSDCQIPCMTTWKIASQFENIIHPKDCSMSEYIHIIMHNVTLPCHWGSRDIHYLMSLFLLLDNQMTFYRSASLCRDFKTLLHSPGQSPHPV